MRYIAVHDHHGSIRTLIEGPDDGPPMVAALEPGLRATEIDVRAVALDTSSFRTDRDAMDALAALAVEVKQEARLVRRDKRQTPGE
jgi:hypothetical protein